jgi:hypothetical protein
MAFSSEKLVTVNDIPVGFITSERELILFELQFEEYHLDEDTESWTEIKLSDDDEFFNIKPIYPFAFLDQNIQPIGLFPEGMNSFLLGPIKVENLRLSVFPANEYCRKTYQATFWFQGEFQARLFYLNQRLRDDPYANLRFIFLKNTISRILGLSEEDLIPYPPKDVVLFGINEKVIGFYSTQLNKSYIVRETYIRHVDEIKESSLVGGKLWRAGEGYMIPHQSIPFDEIGLTRCKFATDLFGVEANELNGCYSVINTFGTFGYRMLVLLGIDLTHQKIHLPEIWKKNVKITLSSEAQSYAYDLISQCVAWPIEPVHAVRRSWITNCIKKAAFLDYNLNRVKMMHSVPRYFDGQTLRFLRAEAGLSPFLEESQNRYDIGQSTWFRDPTDLTIWRRFDQETPMPIGAEFYAGTKDQLFEAIVEFIRVDDLVPLVINFAYDGTVEDLRKTCVKKCVFDPDGPPLERIGRLILSELAQGDAKGRAVDGGDLLEPLAGASS